MKTKNFSVFALSIFAVVLLASLASAATLSTWSLTTNAAATSTFVSSGEITAASLVAGSGLTSPNLFDSTNGANANGWDQADINSAVTNNDYFEIKITPQAGKDFVIKSISFNHTVLTAANTLSFAIRSSEDNYSSNIGAGSSSTTSAVTTVSGLNLFVGSSDGSDSITLRIYGFGDSDVAPGTSVWGIKDINLYGTYTDNDIVSADNEDNGRLTVELKDTTVLSGFGKDTDWLPFDKIEVQVKTTNEDSDKIKNIQLNWGLYDETSGKWIIDDSESGFSLSDGKSQTSYIDFQLNDNIDNLDSSHTYKFYIWATGDAQSDDTETGTVVSEDINPQIDSDFVVLDNIQAPATVQCGSTVQISADAWNVGDNDQEGVYVVAYNADLGLNEKVTIGDISALDNARNGFALSFTMPKDADKTSYPITLTVYDDSGDRFQDDYSDDYAVFTVPLGVEDGSCVISQPASVSANVQDGGKAGQPLTLNVTVQNTGTRTADYEVKATDYDSWASGVTETPQTLTLAGGASSTVSVVFNVNRDVTGEQNFNLQIYSGGQLVATQPVVTPAIEKAGFSLFTGNLISGDNAYLWGLGIFNVILIVVIVVVAVRVAKRRD